MKTIPITSIDTSNRLRPIDEANAQAISASIEERGLIQPIVVQPVGDGYRLTAGGHRLAAMTALGWKELKVGEHVVIREEETDDDARQTEIFENIFRGELSALDRMIALAEMKRIHDAKRGETRGRKRKDVEFKEDKIVAKTAIIFSERFTAEAAKRMGLSERLIREAVSIADALSPAAIKALRGTMLADNQNELRQLADCEDRTAQLNAAKAIKAGEAKNVQQALVHVGFKKAKRDDPQKQIYVTLNKLWGQATPVTRANFLADIGAEMIGKGRKA